jgi:hypothetical protein
VLEEGRTKEHRLWERRSRLRLVAIALYVLEEGRTKEHRLRTTLNEPGA